MNILALDQASKTGWALYQDGEISSGVIPLVIVPKSKGPGHRLVWFQREIDEMFGSFPRGELAVYHEQPFTTDRIAADVIVCGLSMHIDSWCEQRGYRSRVVHNQTVKKYATGSGRATKEQMLRNARIKWPDQVIIDHNQADALWILDFAIYGEK